MKAVLTNRVFESTKEGPKLIGVAGEVVDLDEKQAKNLAGSFSTDKELIAKAEKRAKDTGGKEVQNKSLSTKAVDTK